VGGARAVLDRLTAAQNEHDLEGMLACFHDDYRSEQPLFPSRSFQGIDQVRANWSALLAAIPDFRAEVLRSAADGDTVFLEVRWTGTKADGTPLEERGVLIAGVRDDRISWGRLYIDELSPKARTSTPRSAGWRARKIRSVGHGRPGSQARSALQPRIRAREARSAAVASRPRSGCSPFAHLERGVVEPRRRSLSREAVARPAIGAPSRPYREPLRSPRLD